MKIDLTSPRRSSGVAAGTCLRFALNGRAGAELPAAANQVLEGRSGSGCFLHQVGAIPDAPVLSAAKCSGACGPITADFGIRANHCWRIAELEWRYTG